MLPVHSFLTPLLKKDFLAQNARSPNGNCEKWRSPMRRAATLVLLTSSLLAQEPNNHRGMYHDNRTGTWTPPSEQREWTMTFSNGIGYRRDSQKLKDYTDQSVSYLKHFNSIEASASLLFAWDRVLIKLAADYGWLVSGDLNFKAQSGLYSIPVKFPTFSMGSGYSADVMGSIGCRIKFWKWNRGSLSFIPALGYVYSHFNAFPAKQGRATPPAAAGLTTMEYIRPIQQDWFGPLVEGRIAFSWKEAWRIDFFYQYIPIDFRQTLEQSVSHFFSNPLATANTSREHLGSKSDTTRTQLGGADISYRSPKHWKIGAHFEGSETWTHTAHTISHIKTDAFLPAYSTTQSRDRKKLTVQWLRYSVDFYSSYWF
jgi:hypothetical protein